MTIAILDARDKEYVVVAAGTDLIATYVQQAILAGQNAQEVLDAILAAGLSEGVFASLVAGEAGTTDGQYFWVGEGGTVTLYLNDGGTGSEIAELATAAGLALKVNVIDLAAPTGGEMVGFEQDAIDAVNRNVSGWMRERLVSINDFGGTTVEKMKKAVAALTVRGGGILDIPLGDYSAASADLASPIVLTAGVHIRGNGSTFTITGTTQTGAMFSCAGASNVTIEGLRVIGNNKSTGDNNGAFLNYVMPSSGMTADASNVRVRDIFLDNFAAPNWIKIENQNTTYRVENVFVEGIAFKTRTGNAIGPTNITENSAVVAVNGGDGCHIYNVRVVGVYGDATHIKTGVLLYHAIHNALVQSVTVLNAGYDAVFDDDAGCYAIQVYDSYGDGENIAIKNVTLSGRSCGIYFNGFCGVDIQDFAIFGQTDTVSGTLPKGAIALNGVRDWRISRGKAYDCALGIHATGPQVAERANGYIANVIIDEDVAVPLRIEPYAGQAMDGVTLTDSRFVATGTIGADLRTGNSSTLVLNNFRAVRCHFEGTSYGLEAYALNQATSSDDWRLADCTFTSAASACRIRSMTGKLVIDDCKATCTAASKAFELQACTNLHLEGDTNAITASGGIAFDTQTAAGTIARSVYGVAPGGDVVIGLGAVGTRPTHSGVEGQFVSYINYTAASAGAGQTQVIGERCEGGTVWRPVVETVNAA